MATAAGIEIVYHPNANVTCIVAGVLRRTLIDRPGIATVAQQIATYINAGAIDRRPGAPAQLTGTDAVRYLEPLLDVT
jgi:hypothetical protein